MKAVLLDTHVWMWYMNGNEELNKNVRKIITNAFDNNQAHIAAISLWEVGMLEKKKRIILNMPGLEWINSSIELTHLRVLPITPEIANESCFLPGVFHDDPADRMIVATSRVEQLTLVTRDAKILEYGKNKYISTLQA